MSTSTSSALPRALISRSAVADAAAAAVSMGGQIADVRRDAWGHGLLAIARAVTVAGASGVRVDTTDAIDELAAEGIAASMSAEADIDSRILYGLPDAEGMLVTRPPLRLVGHVLSTKSLRAGEAVSYGYTYRAVADTRIALVTGGYAQGIVRALGNRAQLEIDGAMRPIVGRIAMDVCVVDVGADVPVGAEATYFGGPGPAASALAVWATATGLTVSELLTVSAFHAVREEES